MVRERPDPKRLHNFALPLLGWGCQRVMRFVKEFDCPKSPLSSSLISEGGHLSLVPLPCHQARFSEEDGEGIGAVRVKLISDLRTETDQFQKELLKCDDDVTEVEEESVGKLALAVATARRKEEEAAETRPWNLRPRRATCKAQAASNGYPEKEKKREKFSVALKKKEIEDDLMRLMGRRPPQRKKKGRNNAVQKQLDMLFPGLWLTEVTADTYNVIEVPDKVKR